MPRAVRASIVGALVALAGPVSAFAQGPTPPPQPAPAPAPAPQAGALSLSIASNAALHGRPYFLTGDVVRVVGRVTPAVAGQHVRVRISTPKRKPTVVRTKVAKNGTFQVRCRTRRAVKYSVFAVHRATPEQHAFA